MLMELGSVPGLPRLVGSAVSHLRVPKAQTQLENRHTRAAPPARDPRVHRLPACTLAACPAVPTPCPSGAPSTLAISQTVTRGLSGTRSKQCTLFLTLLASVQSPHPKSATTSDAGLGQG